MSQLPDGCILKGCDNPWFDYSILTCADPSATPVMGDLSDVDGATGVGFTSSFAVEDSTLSWSFSIVSGALPPGLTLAAGSTPQEGTISGTPTTPGIYSFTIEAVNGWGVGGTKAYVITIT